MTLVTAQQKKSGIGRWFTPKCITWTVYAMPCLKKARPVRTSTISQNWWFAKRIFFWHIGMSEEIKVLIHPEQMV